MRASAVLTWFLYGLLVWCLIEMALVPADRWRMGAAGIVALLAIAVVTSGNTPE